MSKKQVMVAFLTLEAEYVAISTATEEAVWLKGYLRIFKHFQKSQQLYIYIYIYIYNGGQSG